MRGEPVDEHNLIELARGGDREAFAELSERRQCFVNSLVRQYVGSRDAPDVAQNIWLAVQRKLWQLEDPAAFSGWLRRVVYHQCLNWRAARALEGEREVQLDAPAWHALVETVASGELPVAAAAEQSLLRAWLSHQLDRLPGDYGLLLRLHYWRGLPYDGIAALTRLPLSTVRWRLHYGRGLLKAQLLREIGTKGDPSDA